MSVCSLSGRVLAFLLALTGNECQSANRVSDPEPDPQTNHTADVRHPPQRSSAAEHRGGTSGRKEELTMATATKVALKPLEDRVVVQANEAEKTTASGLVIPDTAKEKPQEGTVLAVGPGRFGDDNERIPMDVAEGDVVIYS